MKLINILNEIKINKPNSIFVVTDKGKEWTTKFDEFWDLYSFFGFEVDLYDEETSDNFWSISDFSTYVREDIIELNEENLLNTVIKKGIDYGFDAEDIDTNLKRFIKNEFITPIEL